MAHGDSLRRDANTMLKLGTSRGNSAGGDGHVRHALVVSEVALALMLLIGAGLLVGSSLTVAELALAPGTAYDAATLATRIDRYEEALRRAGHYEAAVDVSVHFSPDDTTADVTVNVEPGPRVRVVFAGDPLPENRRDTLVPIRAERSIDLDLLEDLDVDGVVLPKAECGDDVADLAERHRPKPAKKDRRRWCGGAVLGSV